MYTFLQLVHDRLNEASFRGPRVISLKYPGKCADPSCGKIIPAGTKAKWYGHGKVYGLDCHGADCKKTDLALGQGAETPPEASQAPSRPFQVIKGGGEENPTADIGAAFRRMGIGKDQTVRVMYRAPKRRTFLQRGSGRNVNTVYDYLRLIKSEGGDLVVVSGVANAEEARVVANACYKKTTASLPDNLRELMSITTGTEFPNGGRVVGIGGMAITAMAGAQNFIDQHPRYGYGNASTDSLDQSNQKAPLAFMRLGSGVKTYDQEQCERTGGHTFAKSSKFAS